MLDETDLLRMERDALRVALHRMTRQEQPMDQPYASYVKPVCDWARVIETREAARGAADRRLAE